VWILEYKLTHPTRNPRNARKVKQVLFMIPQLTTETNYVFKPTD